MPRTQLPAQPSAPSLQHLNGVTATPKRRLFFCAHARYELVRSRVSPHLGVRPKTLAAAAAAADAARDAPRRTESRAELNVLSGVSGGAAAAVGAAAALVPEVRARSAAPGGAADASAAAPFAPSSMASAVLAVTYAQDRPRAVWRSDARSQKCAHTCLHRERVPYFDAAAIFFFQRAE